MRRYPQVDRVFQILENLNTLRIAYVAETDVEMVVEVAPGGALIPIVSAAWPAAAVAPKKEDKGRNAKPVLMASLQGDTGEADSFAEGVARAYETGAAVALAGLFSGESRRWIGVPTDPFQRRHYWIEAPDPSRQ